MVSILTAIIPLLIPKSKENLKKPQIHAIKRTKGSEFMGMHSLSIN